MGGKGLFLTFHNGYYSIFKSDFEHGGIEVFCLSAKGDMEQIKKGIREGVMSTHERSKDN